MPIDLEPRYDVETIARRYGVTPRTVQRWIETGLIPRAIRVSRNSPYYIPASAIDEFEAKHTVGGVLDDAARESALPPASNE